MAHYRAVPDRYLAFPDFELSPGAVGLPADSRSAWPSSSSTRPRPGGGVLPGAGRRDRVRTGPRSLGGDGRANPVLSTLQPDVEAVLVGPSGRRRGGMLHRARSTPATSWSAVCAGSGGASTAAARPTRRWRRSSSGSGRAQVAAMTSLTFDVVDARPEPHAAVPTIMLRVRVTEIDGGTVHALALRCQIRIEPQRRRYQPEEEDRLYELFGETAPVGRFAAPVSVDPRVDHDRRDSPAPPEFDLPVSAPTTSRSPAPSTSRAGGRGDPADPAVFRARCSPGGSSGLRGRARLLEPGGVVPTAGRGVAGSDGPVLPEQRLAAGQPGHSRPAPAVQGVPGRPHLGPGLRAAAQARRRGRPVSEPRRRTASRGPSRRRRRAVRGLRPLSLPGVVEQEPVALAVRGARPASLQRGRWIRAVVDAHRVPGRAGRTPASRGRIRCLQVQHRAVDVAGPARGELSPGRRSSRSTARSTSTWDEAVDQVRRPSARSALGDGRCQPPGRLPVRRRVRDRADQPVARRRGRPARPSAGAGRRPGPGDGRPGRGGRRPVGRSP